MAGPAHAGGERAGRPLTDALCAEPLGWYYYGVLSQRLAVLAAVIIGVASASPVNYTVSGLMLSDGGTLSGTFDFDPDAVTFSLINLTTSGGSVSATTFTQLSGYSPHSTILATVPSGAIILGTTHTFQMAFFPALTDSGGGSISSGAEYICENADCSAVNGGVRVAVGSGSLVGVPAVPTATPDPNSFLLVGGEVRRLSAVAIIRCCRHLAASAGNAV